MPDFKILEVRPYDADVWLACWSANYDLARFDEDEYNQLIQLAQQSSRPAKYFERVGRWKDSANTDGRWKPNVASVAYRTWMQAEAEQPQCPANGQEVSFLDNWSSRQYEDVFSGKPVIKRFGLSRATTLLHFLSAGTFPIFDSNVIEAMRRLNGVSPRYTLTHYWGTFYPQFLELAASCKTNDFRRLDKALFSYGATKLLV